MLSAVTVTKEEITPFSESQPFTTRGFHQVPSSQHLPFYWYSNLQAIYCHSSQIDRSQKKKRCELNWLLLCFTTAETVEKYRNTTNKDFFIEIYRLGNVSQSRMGVTKLNLHQQKCSGFTQIKLQIQSSKKQSSSY